MFQKITILKLQVPKQRGLLLKQLLKKNLKHKQQTRPTSSASFPTNSKTNSQFFSAILLQKMIATWSPRQTNTCLSATDFILIKAIYLLIFQEKISVTYCLFHQKEKPPSSYEPRPSQLPKQDHLGQLKSATPIVCKQRRLLHPLQSPH